MFAYNEEMKNQWLTADLPNALIIRELHLGDLQQTIEDKIIECKMDTREDYMG